MSSDKDKKTESQGQVTDPTISKKLEIEEKDKADADLDSNYESDDLKTVDSAIEDEAQQLLVKHNKKQIWRCPKRGYWFFDKERVKDYERSLGTSLEAYQLKLKSDKDEE